MKMNILLISRAEKFKGLNVLLPIVFLTRFATNKLSHSIFETTILLHSVAPAHLVEYSLFSFQD